MFAHPFHIEAPPSARMDHLARVYVVTSTDVNAGRNVTVHATIAGVMGRIDTTFQSKALKRRMKSAVKKQLASSGEFWYNEDEFDATYADILKRADVCEVVVRLHIELRMID
jgi:hypothetical protein